MVSGVFFTYFLLLNDNQRGWMEYTHYNKLSSQSNHIIYIHIYMVYVVFYITIFFFNKNPKNHLIKTFYDSIPKFLRFLTLISYSILFLFVFFYRYYYDDI